MPTHSISREEKRQEDYATAYQRAGNACEICGVRGQNIHHRKPRGMGGSRDEGGPQNLMVLCGSGTVGCHGWIEANREEARRQGWLLERTEQPYKVPLAYRGYWAVLTEGGLVVPLSGLDLLDVPRPLRLREGKLAA